MARKNWLLINIASVVALAPERLNGTYSGTKAYVVNFTQALKNEVEGTGITVQAVLPGATATPFWEESGRPLWVPWLIPFRMTLASSAVKSPVSTQSTNSGSDSPSATASATILSASVSSISPARYVTTIFS